MNEDNKFFIELILVKDPSRPLFDKIGYDLFHETYKKLYIPTHNEFDPFNF